jgi:hydroxymethylpyrimidine/phosphomethylpyrimidine kinase
MLGTAEVASAVTEALTRCAGVPIVVDPVWRAGSGAELLSEAGLAALKVGLLPLAALVTPNLAEAEMLSGRQVCTIGDMREAARAIALLGPKAVLVKGGHLPGEPVDVLLADGEIIELGAERVPLPRRVHGTGCALSTAAAVFLAGGDDVVRAVRKAKAYVAAGVRHARVVGRGALVLDFGAAARGD